MILLLWTYKLLKSRLGAVTAIYTCITLVASHMLGMMAALQAQITQFDGLTIPAFSSAGLNIAPLSLMNYFLPLDIALAQFLAWLALWLACAAIRVVKSFIPTVS